MRKCKPIPTAANLEMERVSQQGVFLEMIANSVGALVNVVSGKIAYSEVIANLNTIAFSVKTASLAINVIFERNASLKLRVLGMIASWGLDVRSKTAKSGKEHL